MPLSAGTPLGPYEILSLLGAGGMGEVYKAKDKRLDRIVAIKVLPGDLSAHPEHRQRFEREAHTIASLNHPHICVLYDIGHQDGIHYLVMEYLEGDTLAQRLSKEALPVDQALQYAIQIVDALDKAHRQGVTHRDLKPGNVMLTRSGAKLLDFGLAKLKAAESGGALLTALPTQSPTLTAEGTILGTLQYMAPEQVEGQEADARTDLFALGAVLYEMVTGKKAFEGKTQASLIGAILKDQPRPLSIVQPLTPPALDHVIRTCLAKEPDDRWQTAHDLLVQLKWLAEAGSQAGVSAPVLARRRSRQHFLMAATITLLLTTLMSVTALLWVGGYLSERPVDVGEARFSLSPPEGWTLAPSPAAPQLAVSPDGRKIAFVAVEQLGKPYLWVRRINSLAAQHLEKTEGAYFPFWSPDGQFIGFFAGGKLKKIPVTGGSPQTICEAEGGEGAGWSREGVIIFAPAWTGVLYRVPAGGGVATPLTKLDESRGEFAHVWPQFLPDGRRFLYLARSPKSENAGIYLASIDSPESRLLLQTPFRAAFAPPDFLLFVRDRVLLAQRIDLKRMELTGEPVAVAEDVNQGNVVRAAFTVSDNGVLAFRTGASGARRRLVWRNREGKELGVLGQPDAYGLTVGLSSDEKRLLVTRTETATGQSDVWTAELASGILSRLTFEGGGDALWSPDGSRVIFSSVRKGRNDLYEKVLGSAREELLFESEENKFAEGWSPDGRLVLFISLQGKTAYTVPVTGDKKAEKVFETAFEADEFHFSPDGRWIAYNSIESGRWEVYVASFPGFEKRRQVSHAGGCQALWRKDGKELYYLGLDGKLMAVDVKAVGEALETGAPKVLFQTPLNADPLREQYCVTGDSRRFLLLEDVSEKSEPFTLVLDWPAAITK